jgi:hypothetical protein
LEIGLDRSVIKIEKSPIMYFPQLDEAALFEWEHTFGCPRRSGVMHMKNHFLASTVLVLLCASPLVAHSASDPNTCHFEKLTIKLRMPREQVEQQIAALSGEQSSYRIRGGDLRGGAVEYRDENCTLTVEYRPGMLPPYVIGPGGVSWHLAPIDESVDGYAIKIVGGEPKE